MSMRWLFALQDKERRASKLKHTKYNKKRGYKSVYWQQARKQTNNKTEIFFSQPAGGVQFSDLVPINDLFTSSDCDSGSKYSTQSWTNAFKQPAKPQTSVTQLCWSTPAASILHAQSTYANTVTACKEFKKWLRIMTWQSYNRWYSFKMQWHVSLNSFSVSKITEYAQYLSPDVHIYEGL